MAKTQAQANTMLKRYRQLQAQNDTTNKRIGAMKNDTSPQASVKTYLFAEVLNAEVYTDSV